MFVCTKDMSAVAETAATTAEAPRMISVEEVAQHKDESSCWIIIGEVGSGGRKVYDVTSYLGDHPGGMGILLDYAGTDANEIFEDYGHSNGAREILKKYYIGDVLEN